MDLTVIWAFIIAFAVFAYVVMRLVDEQRLDLDRPVADYRRPDHLGDDPNLARITIRDVLRHSSGLPNWSDKKLATVAPPGTRCCRSDLRRRS